MVVQIGTNYDAAFEQAILETVDDARTDFSPERDFNAWRLSEMTTKQRGERCEKAVCTILSEMGYTGIEHIGGSHPFDIDTDQGRVEVKSAMVTKHGNRHQRYLFQAVKPENFDDLVLVFIHPDYIEVRHLTAKEEDILTSRSLLKSGMALNRLVDSLVLDKRIRAMIIIQALIAFISWRYFF